MTPGVVESTGDDVSSIVATLRRRREALGLTQCQLADRMGVVQSRVSQLENSDCSPRLDMLRTWAEALGFTLDVRLVDRLQS